MVKSAVTFKQKETDVQNAIAEFLRWSQWKVLRLNSSNRMAESVSKSGKLNRRPIRSYIVYDLRDIKTGKENSSSGAPDILAWKGGRCLMLEVKTNSGKQSDTQKAFQRFIGGDCEYYVCRSVEDVQKIL